MATRKVYEKETTHQEFDFSTGEMIHESKTKEIVKYVKDKPHFILVYLEDLSGLLKLDNLSDIKVLACIWEMSGIETGEVFLIKSRKEQIAEKTQLTYRVVEVSISRLAKKGLIIKGDEGRSGLYYINPNYFWKGQEISRKDKKHELNIKISYKFESENDNVIDLYPSNEEISGDNKDRE